MTQANGEGLIRPDVYGAVLTAVAELFDRFDGDDEAALSIYLSLKASTQTIEKELQALGIKPVEVIVE